MKINTVDLIIVFLIIFGIIGLIAFKNPSKPIDTHNKTEYNYNRMYNQE